MKWFDFYSVWSGGNKWVCISVHNILKNEYSIFSILTYTGVIQPKERKREMKKTKKVINKQFPSPRSSSQLQSNSGRLISPDKKSKQDLSLVSVIVKDSFVDLVGYDKFDK